MSVHDYETANELLKSNTRFKRRKVANNTWIERGTFLEDNDVIHLILHETAILVYYKDGDIEFETNGWGSKTTRDRMNSFQKRINIYSYKKKWWYGDFNNPKPFYDGLRVKTNGEIIVPNFEDQVESENFGHLGHY